MALDSFVVELVQLNETTGSHSMYIVRCPRKTCGWEFWVPIAWARLRAIDGVNGQQTVVTGRPCPHCSRTAEIPADVRIEPVLRRVVKIKRRSRA